MLTIIVLGAFTTLFYLLMKYDHPLTTIEEKEEEPLDPFPVVIFDAAYCGEPVPKGFDAVRIPIDGTLKADLTWKKEHDGALAYARKGLKIFWEIDLGLPNVLHALSNRTQFLSLTLSLEHFCKTLWKTFRKETVGLCLFRGSLDLSQNYPWDEEQLANLQEWMLEHHASEKVFFCRDVFSEYFGLLASGVPDSLPLFLLFDASEIEDPFIEAQLLNKEYFSRFHLGVKTRSAGLGGEIAWEGMPKKKGIIAREIKHQKTGEKAKLAVCLPRSHSSSLQIAFALLQTSRLPFRVIPEGELAIEWDGLDELIVDTQLVSAQFKRRLQGFCAAGGRVVSIGEPLGLAEEVSFEHWA
jgi:hypothetical protein